MKQEVNVPTDSSKSPIGNPYLVSSWKNKAPVERNTQLTSVKGVESKKKKQEDLAADLQIHHQTTSKKVNDTKIHSQSRLVHEPNNKSLNLSQAVIEGRNLDSSLNASNSTSVVNTTSELCLKSRNPAAGLNQQVQNLKQKNKYISSDQIPKHQNVISQLSTNPSTSQQNIRNSIENNKSFPQFIQIKGKLNQNATALQQKQLLVLNQKLINQPTGVDIKDVKESSNGFHGSKTDNYQMAQFNNKKKLEKTMNIYNQYAMQQQLNAYTDLGVVGQKSRINQNQFNKSRNSNFSVKSNNSQQAAEGDYPESSKQASSMHRVSNYFQSKLQQAQSRQNNSFQASGKQSNHHNTQTSFGKKHSVSQQEVKIEVRGSNKINAQLSQQQLMNRSNHNKFLNTNYQKANSRNAGGQGGTQSKQSHSQNIVMSKHKPSTKSKDKLGQSKTNFGVDQNTLTSISFNKEAEGSKDDRGHNHKQKAANRRAKRHDKAESLQPANRNATKSDMNTTFDNLNMTLTHKFRLHSKKSDNEGGSVQNVNLRAEKQQSKNSTGQFSSKFLPQNTIQPNSKLRGQKPEGAAEDGNRLPQIVMQQHKSESNMWNKRTYNFNDRKEPRKNSDRRGEDSLESSKVKGGHKASNVSMSKSSVKQGANEAFESNLNIMGNLSNATSAHDFPSHYVGSAFADQRQEVREPNFGPGKINKNSRITEGSMDKTELNRLNSNNSMDYNLSEAQQSQSVDRKHKGNYYKKSIEHSVNMNSEKQKYSRIHLAPIQQTREGFGMAPGTANTTSYKGAAPQGVAPQLQYKMQSQQCNSEVVQHQLSQSNLHHQQYYNNYYENQSRPNPTQQRDQRLNYQGSAFDGSYDYMFNPQYEKLDALDPQDEMNDIARMPITRNQKSQGTYRQTYNKYNNIMVNYQPKDNHSVGETYAFKNKPNAAVTDNNSQLNDIQINLRLNYSNNSQSDGLENPTQLQKVESQTQKTTGPPGTEEKPHPFNGPKLHLYKKGQSKSSQMKSRKIRVSEQKYLADVNSQSNIVYSQCDSSSNYQNYQPRQQLSEGGPAGYQRANNYKNIKGGPKEGHVNISEILRENRQSNGLLQNNIQMRIEQIQNQNSRSQQISQENISQSSFEMGQGTPYDKNGELLPPFLDLDSQGKHLDNVKPQSSIEHGRDNLQPQEFSEIQAFETHSAQYPTHQMKTLQQHTRDSGSRLNLPLVSNNNSSGAAFNINQQRLSSPYIIHQQQNLTGTGHAKYSSNMQSTMHIKQDNTDSSVHHSLHTAQQDNSSTRPNTTKKVGGQIYIGQSTDLGKELTAKSSQKSFLHPKVGKHSKYPPVFKLDSTGQGKSTPIVTSGHSQVVMEGRDNSVTESNATSNIFAHISTTQEGAHFSAPNTSAPVKKLEPKQTGDFPSPQEIREYHRNLKKEETPVNNDDFEDQSESDFRGSELQSVAKSQKDICLENAMKVQTSQPIRLNDLIANEKFKSLINERQHGGDLLPGQTESEDQSQKYCTPQRQDNGDKESKHKNIQSTGGANRNLKSRQSGLQPGGSSQGVGLPRNSKQTSEIGSRSQKRTYQQEIDVRKLQESGNVSVSRCSDTGTRQQASQLPSIQRNGSRAALNGKTDEKQAQSSAVKPGTKPVKAMPIRKPLANKLSTIEAKSTSNSMTNQNGQVPHVFTPRGQKSNAQGGPVFEINQQLNDQSQQIFQNQATVNDREDNRDNSSLGSHRYKPSSRCGAAEGRDSMRDTNQNAFHSVAQTPCFAETPYGTDQFKGYKITPDQVRVPTFLQTGFSRGKDDSAASQTRDRADQNSNQSHSYAEENSHSLEPETSRKKASAKATNATKAAQASKQ